MDKELKSLKDLLLDYDNEIQKIANKIIEALKSETTTYKELEIKLNEFKREVYFKYTAKEKYNYLFTSIKKSIEAQKNDLPLTNRSEIKL